jgi:hypothetical protein
MQAVFETIFDIFYLSSVITIGIIMIRKSGDRKQYKLYGIMAVVLGCGDAFHLIPRAYALCTDGLAAHTAALGIGKLITSITMTVFYLLLYYVWRERYNIQGKKNLSSAVWALALCRVFLCLLPQNEWTSSNAPLSMGIIRNVPFLILGILIIVLTYRSTKKSNDKTFRYLWLTIVLSFACYIPVVLFADAYPLVGMLMIPKTCAYLATVIIGYNAMNKESASL